MKKTTIVAVLLLLNSIASANTLIPEINQLESQWASIYYSKISAEQRHEYPRLLEKTQQLLQKYPRSAELLIWQAIIISTNAAYEDPFTALDSIAKAKRLLESAIQQKPEALEGAAFVALGTLYYMTPGWPISFGSNDKAEYLLKKALHINPNSIDGNYFYADFLLSQDKTEEAVKYLQRALQSPTRTEQIFADTELKKEVLLTLQKTHQSKIADGQDQFMSLFSSAKSN